MIGRNNLAARVEHAGHGMKGHIAPKRGIFYVHHVINTASKKRSQLHTSSTHKFRQFVVKQHRLLFKT
jgi:hypothetical protein